MKRILEVKKQIGTLSKNDKNPFYKSQYLNLNDLLNHVEPLLWEQNLLLLQPIIENKVHSIIIDCETNKVLTQSFMELPPITDPQKLGSAITYYRRYTLKSLLSIAEKDDDGNNAANKEVKPTRESIGLDPIKPNLIVESDEFKGALKKNTALKVLEDYFTITEQTAKEYEKQLSAVLAGNFDQIG